MPIAFRHDFYSYSFKSNMINPAYPNICISGPVAGQVGLARDREGELAPLRARPNPIAASRFQSATRFSRRRVPARRALLCKPIERRPCLPLSL